MLAGAEGGFAMTGEKLTVAVLIGGLLITAGAVVMVLG